MTPVAPAGAALVGRRYHFHSGGIGYAVTTVVLVIGAVNSQNNLLFWLFGLGVAGLIVSGFMSGGSLMRLGIEREIGSVGRVGDDLVVRYRLHNRSRVFPAYAITIEELEESAKGSGDWRARLSRGIAFAPYIPARGSVVVETRVRAGRRGVATLGPLRVWTTFPFGLTKKSVTFFQRTTVLIRPWIAPLSAGLLRSLGGAGAIGSNSRRDRSGDEFFSLREYAPGDSLRSVAWRSTARLGHAVVREMATRPSRRLWVVLCMDLDAGANEQVISVGAGLLEEARRAGFEAGVAMGDGSVVDVPRPLRGMERLSDQLAVISAAPGDGQGGMAAAARAGDGFVVVCAAGGGPETIPGERVLVENPAIYRDGLPAGLHPTFNFDDSLPRGWFGRLFDKARGAWGRPET